MLRTAILGFVVASFVGWPANAATTSVSLPGVMVSVPDDDRWERVERVENGPEVVRFERHDGRVSSSIELTRAEIEEAIEDRAFLEASESSLETEFSKKDFLSVHYYYTRHDGAACVAYDGILGSKSGKPTFMFIKGMVCRLPSNLARTVRLEAARLSDQRMEAEEAAFYEFASSVIDTLVFQ